jgi:hypothetical protein
MFGLSFSKAQAEVHAVIRTLAFLLRIIISSGRSSVSLFIRNLKNPL